MSIYNTIKIECDSKLPERRATDTQTERPAEFWLFNNLKFGVVLFCNGELFSDFSNVSKLVLGVKECDNGGYPLESDTFEILKEVAAADIVKNLTETQRANGSVHATFAIEANDIAATMKAGMKWLVVQAVDSSGGALTFFGGNILCKNDASSGTASGATLTRFEDYKTACENAKEAAANSATQAGELRDDAEYLAAEAIDAKTAAESSAQSAEVSAGIAAQQASDAESAKDAAVAAKNTATTQAGLASASATNAAQSATTAQQAAAQAVEITDPEGWRIDTRAMIANLALTKSDSGTLYFTGGAATATPNLAFDTLSVLFKTDFDFFVDQTSTVFYPFILGTRNSGKYFTCQGGNVLRVMTVDVNTNDVVSIGYFTRTDISAVATGRLNSLAFVFKKLANGNAHVSLFVNGTAILNSISTAVPYSVVPNSASVNTWAGTISSASKGTVGYSDFRIFNFDVSATDAPYSLADYQAGKRLPPFLSGGVYLKSNPDVDTQFTPAAGKLGQTTQGTLAKSDSGYTLTLTSASTRRFWFKFDKKYPAGTWFRVRRGALTWNGMETTGSRISQTALNVGTSTTSPYTIAVSNLPTSEAVDVVFQTPIEANMVGFIVWNGSDVPTATIPIPYFEFEVLGASVALENYTFDGKIRDASGNESHATISGSVAGDMDNSVNQIYSAFSAKYTQENA